jgi:Tumour suppressor protein
MGNGPSSSSSSSSPSLPPGERGITVVSHGNKDSKNTKGEGEENANGSEAPLDPDLLGLKEPRPLIAAASMSEGLWHWDSVQLALDIQRQQARDALHRKAVQAEENERENSPHSSEQDPARRELFSEQKQDQDAETQEENEAQEQEDDVLSTYFDPLPILRLFSAARVGLAGAHPRMVSERQAGLGAGCLRVSAVATQQLSRVSMHAQEARLFARQVASAGDLSERMHRVSAGIRDVFAAAERLNALLPEEERLSVPDIRVPFGQLG